MLITGKQAEKDKDMRAKRCFDVKYKDGHIRWILAAPAHPEFIHAMNVMKQTKIMEAVQIKVEEDRATMSKAPKISGTLSRPAEAEVRPKEAPKEVKKETSTARVRLCTKTKVVRDSLVRVLQSPVVCAGHASRVRWVALQHEVGW